MDIQEQLDEIAASARVRHGPDRTARLEAGFEDLSGSMDGVPDVGDHAPGFSLPDGLGGRVTLEELLESGPVVIVFFRGGWCAYCNLMMRVWQEHLTDLESLGASLVAISGEEPDNSLTANELASLEFSLLSDSKLEVATQYGLVWDLDEDLEDLNRSLGRKTEDLNALDEWRSIVPGTFVVDQHGRVVFAEAHADYRGRTDPQDALAVLRELRQGGSSDDSDG